MDDKAAAVTSAVWAWLAGVIPPPVLALVGAALGALVLVWLLDVFTEDDGGR